MNNQEQNTTGKAAPKIELLPPSMSMRVGNRRLTMSWRPRKQLPHLLHGLLRRSWRAMFGSSLRMSATAIAICAAWNVPAMAAAPDVNTLPTGGTVTYGNATFSQTGNTLNINQTTGQAIANFTTFSIGANAVVNVNQPSAAAAFLARVTGSDPSLIYGLLKSNGTVALINQNGILVGPTGVVDVARFIASTLSIRDSDFLAGRLNFSNGSLAGNVENQGTIKTLSGGSVYLIGANVSNSGVITSPNGEILLAAGQTVQLVDTGTPGVTVNVTGATGKVTNLGSITAEAGRIGVAAGLIVNSGNINASSVVSDGGRIFLRASQNLTTTATSRITADSNSKGGSVVLYSDKVAYLDGDISVTGAAGDGGFVETSGKQSLDVIKLPTIGSGGEWYIDPYDLTVVATGDSNYANQSGVISSIGSSSTISAGVVNGMLNGGTSVSLVTGDGAGPTGGNITVNANIEKTSGSAATLTLNADLDIRINANITSTSGALGLNLNTNYNGNNTGAHTTTVTGATIKLNGGILTANDGATTGGNGNLVLGTGGVVELGDMSTTLNTGNLTIGIGATVNSTYNAGVHVTGMLTNAGTLNLQNSALTTGGLTNSGSATLGNVSGSLGTVNNTVTGTLGLSSMFAGIGATTVSNAGTLTLSNGSTLNAGAVTNSGTATLTSSTLNASTFTNTNTGTISFVDSSVSATDNISNSGQFSLSNGTINTVNGFVNQVGATLNLATQGRLNNGAVSNLGTVIANGNNMKFENGISNSGTMSITGSLIANGTVSNEIGGTLNLGGASSQALITGSGSWTNSGQLNALGAADNVNISSGLTNNLGGIITVQGSGANLHAGQFINAGALTVAANANVSGNTFLNTGNTTLNGGGMVFNAVTNEVGGNLSGTGTINVSSGSGVLVNNGTLAPGGDGTVGTLTVNGGYQQNSTGTLLIDVAGASNYDVLSLSQQSVLTLNGTLQTKLSGGYAPALGASFAVINGGTFNEDSGVFRHVTGDVLTAGGLRMIKPVYNKSAPGVTLSVRGSEDITYNGGNWGDASAWSTYYFPTVVDNIIVPTSATLSHSLSDGIDSVNSITLNNNAGLDIVGGNVNVGNISSVGTTSINIGNSDSNGVLNVSGAVRVSGLTLSGNSAINGDTGSVLSVTDIFSQSIGSIINSSGAVSLSQASGDLTVGNITASNLVLQAQNGAIKQAFDETRTTSLHVTRQLLTSSVTGTTLNSVTNRIAAFAANNRGMGDIVLVNNLEVADTSAVKINGVTNANGSISINNTGAAITTVLGSGANFLTTLPTDPDSQSVPTLADRLTTLGIVTNGTVSAAGTGHSVTMATHSPLTIGSGGVTSSGAITLSAGAPDNLVINGVITSNGGGAISLSAGGSIFVNANIFTQGFYNGGTPTPTYAPGVSVTDSNGTTIPVAQVVQQIINPIIAQNIAPASNSVVTSVTTAQTVNNPVVPPTVPVSTPNPVTSSTTMTTGGEPGSFGGEESGGTQSSSANSGVPKASPKMFCN